jgi:cation diffusion facilitator CzcD-associated flavoprotein CzcO
MNDAATIVMEKPPAEAARDAIVRWLARFEAALNGGGEAALAALFAEECHYRDMLAFSWTIRPDRGAESIAGFLANAQKTVGAHGFALALGRTPPRVVRRLGVEVYEAIFRFETATARGLGVVRLPTEAPTQAWVLMTSLNELKGHEEQIGVRRPSGDAYSRNFGGLNWLDQRDVARGFADRDPAVLVVGGGQNGLAVAACLGQLGIDTLVVDKYPRIGDNWRVRYHSLALHNQIHVNHLPYMPFPPTWPKYIPKDMLGNWLEMYAEAMQLNCWSNTEFVSGSYDAASGRWTAVLRLGDGSERVMHPAHVILSNGTNGIAHIPDLPGLKDFAGDMFHSHGFKSGAPWRGKTALVLGTGNSGHDVAQDLHNHGVDTTIIQRGSTTVVSIEPSAKLNYALYEEGPPLEDCDLIGTATTYPLMIRGYKAGVKRMVEFDRKMIEGLQSIGFKWDIGEDETGHQMKYRRRCGGYYLDAGCAQLMIDGEVGLLQYDTIERFVPEGALLKDGTIKRADLLVLATGYYDQQTMVRRLLGDAVADRVGQVWGIDAVGEMANMFKRTPQPGLWFMGGGLTQSRIYSKYVALQIKAIELGYISAAMPITAQSGSPSGGVEA